MKNNKKAIAHPILIILLVFLELPFLIGLLFRYSNLQSISQNAIFKEYFAINEIRITGNNYLPEPAIQNSMPADQGTLFWLLNTATVRSAILKNPFIQDAKINVCNDYNEGAVIKLWRNWGCFEVEVTEKEPKFLAPNGDKVWVLGESGEPIITFTLSELAIKLPKLMGDHIHLLKIFEGLIQEGVSTDTLAARFKYLKEAVSVIEPSMERNITRLTLKDPADISVHFEDLPFDVVFPGVENLDKEDLKTNLLGTTERLKKLLLEIAGKESTVASIDLAFDKMGVVQFKEVAAK